MWILKNSIPFFFSLFFTVFTLVHLSSCSKESGGNPNPNNQNPRVGSKWVYRLTTYHASGGVNTQTNVTYRAAGMETLGGEQWLKIVDSATGSTIIYLKEKADGLYQYINNNAYLLCKYPAAVSDTYSGYAIQEAANYSVQSINQSMDFGMLGNLTVNHYTGTVGSETVDQLWYNTRVWLAQRYIYTKPPLGNYYRSASLIIQNFIY
jgi:hypothetical protein